MRVAPELKAVAASLGEAGAPGLPTVVLAREVPILEVEFAGLEFAARAVGRGRSSNRVDELVAGFRPHHTRIERAISAMRLAGDFRDLVHACARPLSVAVDD